MRGAGFALVLVGIIFMALSGFVYYVAPLGTGEKPPLAVGMTFVLSAAVTVGGAFLRLLTGRNRARDTLQVATLQEGPKGKAKAAPVPGAPPRQPATERSEDSINREITEALGLKPTAQASSRRGPRPGPPGRGT
jgi:hypothetical protein